MRALVQRVERASVSVVTDGVEEIVGSIGAGLTAFVGVTHDDTPADAQRLARKLWHLRVFDDGEGAMNASCADLGGRILVVSQFTLYGDTRKGRRPSFVAAAPPDLAEERIDQLVEALRDLGTEPATGRFRHHMRVSLINDGPVTLSIEV